MAHRADALGLEVGSGEQGLDRLLGPRGLLRGGHELALCLGLGGGDPLVGSRPGLGEHLLGVLPELLGVGGRLVADGLRVTLGLLAQGRDLLVCLGDQSLGHRGGLGGA